MWKDKEKRKEYDKKRQQTPEYKQKQKEWRDKNKGYYKEWSKNNRDKCRLSVKKWRLKNKEYCNKKSVQYMKDRPWLKAYQAAITRCNNKKTHNYKNYGGRGIKMLMTRKEVKELWDRDATILVRPTLDRIDNNGNYEFSNCRFIEMSENIAKSNRERNKKIK